MLNARDYRPPLSLRSPHLQSVLGSSGLRQRRGREALAAVVPVDRKDVVEVELVRSSTIGK